jgi:hypothetical protein
LPISLRLSLIAIAALVLSGCGPDKEIGSLASQLSATSKGIGTAVESFYKDLNDANRKLYIEETKLEEDAHIPATDAPIPRTGLTDQYPPDFISVRSLTAQMIEAHCKQVDLLANNKNAKELHDSMAALNDQIQDLGKKLDATNVNMSDNFGSIIKRFANPISYLVDLAANFGLGIYREHLTQEAILKDPDAIIQACSNLQKTLEDSASGTKLRAKRVVALYKRVYTQRMKLHPANTERDKMLEDMVNAAKFQSEVARNNPSLSFAKLASMYGQLAQHVRSIQTKPGKGTK